MAAITDPLLLGAMSIGISLSAGALAAGARRDVQRAREAELREASGLLRAHCEFMEKLDDDAMPPSLLELVVNLSHLLHDPEISKLARTRLSANWTARPFDQGDIDDAEEISRDYQWLADRRRDLATAFIQALVTGVLSFEKRWPECAGKMAPGLTSLVTSPINEAQRVVRAAGHVHRSRSSGPVTAVSV